MGGAEWQLGHAGKEMARKGDIWKEQKKQNSALSAV